MAKLREHLRERKAAVLKRWLNDAVSVYADKTAKFLLKQKDPFANPVGNALREGTASILDIVLDQGKPEDATSKLEGILRIRAIQDLPPSAAIQFLFRLKEVLRAELGKTATKPGNVTELAELDSAVDSMALVAFDIYMKCREEVFELRVNEVKRGVSYLQRRLGMGDFEFEPDEEPAAEGTSQRGDNR